jgi:hypothetical protein
MKLHVGVTEMRGKSARFPFSLLELGVKVGMPGPRALRAMTADRPDLLVALRAPLDLPSLPGALEFAPLAETLRELTPAAIVLPTGPRFGPTRENRALLKKLAESLRAEGRTLAWEPHGVFEIAEAARWAAEADVVLVTDWTREAAVTGPVGYTRLRALGRGGPISAHHVDRLLELLPDFGEAFVIVEGGDGALRLKKELQEALGVEGDDDGFEEDDDDLDEDDGEFEDDEDEPSEDETD